MNKAHKLILHIGTPKTGTSALQYFLSMNNEDLKASGYCYPDIPHELARMGYQRTFGMQYENGNFLEHHVNGQNGELQKESEEWESFRMILLRELENYDVILSEEKIWYWNTEKIIEAIKEICGDMIVIVYLRRQDRYVESLWNQEVKSESCMTETFEDYSGKQELQRDYLEKLNRIKTIVPRENIIVRVYESSRFAGGKIWSDFIHALQIPLEIEACILPDRPINISLPGKYVEAKRQINQILSQYEPEVKRNINNDFLKAVQLCGGVLKQ